MGTLFSSTTPSPQKTTREKPKLSDQDRAVLDLKLARDKLKRFQSKMESESSVLLQKAQATHKTGNKTKAVYYMKIKKLKESKVDDLNGELLNIEKMVNTIEWATQSMQVFSAMEKANNALSAIHKVMPIERVEELMDDVADSIDYQAEIDRALVGSAVSVDEESLEEELAEMERSLLGATGTSNKDASVSLPEAPTTPILPIPPSATPVINTSAVETPERDEREMMAS